MIRAGRSLPSPVQVGRELGVVEGVCPFHCFAEQLEVGVAPAAEIMAERMRCCTRA